MSSLNREEEETAMGWASQKKQVGNGGMIFMSSLAKLP